MDYKCIKIDDISGKELFYRDEINFYRLCYLYPLIIFTIDNFICFYGKEVKLEPKEIQLLLAIVEHNTKKLKTHKPRGISAQTLCKRIGNKQRAEKDNYYSKRLAQHKHDIFNKIKKEFKVINENYETVTEFDNEKILFKGQEVEITSPYYSFDLFSSLKTLFYSIDKKFYTDFYLTGSIND